MGAGRRDLLRGALATLVLAGCGGAAPAAPASARPKPLPPLAIPRLTSLLAVARLRWVIVAEPRRIASVPFLIPSIGQVISEKNFENFAASSGIDLRQAREAVIATYADDEGGDVTFYLVRHSGDPLAIERLFRSRLVADEKRVIDRPDLIRVSGKIGTTSEVMVILGRDVVGYQQRGSVSRGPARVAALFATGKLKRSPSLLAEDPLRALAARFGPTPAQAFALGPFEGELARGARGLLAGATAIGAAARPSARDGIALVIAVSGDFTTSGAAASDELLAAWSDLASGGFGHLLALDEPVEPPLATHSHDAVTVAVELDPRKLARGLAAATSGTLADIMR